MAQTLEEVFQRWAQPPGKTEQEKCDNAERAIRKAIDSSDALSGRSARVFPQGSYRNRTNISMESDVDICVLCDNTISYDLPDGWTAQDVGLTTPASYPYAKYKNDVEGALTDYLGSGAVKRGNKAFDIHANAYRVDADAVAVFEYRRYSTDGTWITGTSFKSDSGVRTINWPDQNYDNGVAKNDSTGRRFKGVVRILKRLANEMRTNKINSAQSIPSFLLECLVWNVPHEGFQHDELTADVRYAIAHLFNETRVQETCNDWGEINELKYLFRGGQPWTRDGVNKFFDDAWNYLGFK
jgi:hypothetical protein